MNVRARSPGLWGVCGVAFLWLALDGALHWDEPAYLYTGCYLSLEQIIRGDFQPSGIENFYLTRPLHVLMIHAVTSLTGPGMAALASVVAVCTGCLVGFLLVTRQVLRELMPGTPCLNPAMALGLLIPVIPYLAFKTLPESAALLCSATALLALIRLAKGGTLSWAGLAVLSVTLTLWLKGPMLLLVGSGVVAIVMVGGEEVRRWKLIGFTVAAVLVGLGLAYAAVVALGIDPSIYTGGVSRVGVESEPIAARILNNGVEFGVFILVLPLAFLSSQKREVLLLAAWFLIATAPLAILFPSMEARYQLPNVPALIGLTALALHRLSPWISRLWQTRRLVTAAGLAAVGAVVVISDALAISVMQHEVRIGQIHRVLNQLDDTYGRGDYAVLTAWQYTDYLYLRVVYPDLPVYSVHQIKHRDGLDLSLELMRSSQQTYYPDRLVLNPGDMDRLAGRTPMLFGFHENFAIENLRAVFEYLPTDALTRALDSTVQYDSHLGTAWLWDDPGYELKPVVRVGHYRAFEVRPKASEQGVSATDGSVSD